MPAGQLVDRRREVREEAASERERFVLRLGLVVDGTVRDVHVAAAELVLVVVRSGHREVDERGTGDHHLCGVLDDDRVVTRRHTSGADAGNRAERKRHRRGHRQVGEHDVPAAHLRDRRAPELLDRLHRAAAPHAVDESDVRHPQLERQALGVIALGTDRGVRGAAADGEVVAGHDHRSTIDSRSPEHEVRRGERDQLAVVVVRADARNGADLVERPGIDQAVDAFADRELSEFVLASDLVGPSHRLRHLRATTQLLELGLPSHAANPASRPAEERKRPLEDRLDVGRPIEEVIGPRDCLELDRRADGAERLRQSQSLVERDPGVELAVLDEEWRRVSPHV